MSQAHSAGLSNFWYQAVVRFASFSPSYESLTALLLILSASRTISL
jgi:hypothetical protein